MFSRLFRRLFGPKIPDSHELNPEEAKFLSVVEESPHHPFADPSDRESEAQAPQSSVADLDAEETPGVSLREATAAKPVEAQGTVPATPSEGEETPAEPLPEPPPQDQQDAPAPDPPDQVEAELEAEAEAPEPGSQPTPFRDPLLNSEGEGPAMVWLPGGEFSMGEDQDCGADEKPAHPVSLDGFAIGQYPVTFAEYDLFCEATGRDKPDDRGWGREDRPVINLSWRDADLYCEWLSRRTGLGYRLCTEAEWEYACRAGSDSRYCFGDHPILLGEYGWFRDNAEGSTHPVGLKQANAWGIHDIHGNVWEWVVDWFESYQPGALHNPTGPAQGSARVIRGGAWDTGADACRSASRDSSHPALNVRGLGFRLARGGPPPGVEAPPPGPHYDDFELLQDQPEAPELVYIPGGNFFMGSSPGQGVSRERPLHLVSLDSFALGRYPVTVAEYLRFVAATGRHAPDWMDEDSSFHLDNGSDSHYQRVAVDPEQDRHPVVGVSHEDAEAYCQWLSDLTGEIYELPTEAEWEYACRAGSDTLYSFGDDPELLDGHAWFDDNSGLGLKEVGTRLCNAWELHDMHGLVWEWVADWYGEYSHDPVENPRGPLIGSHRVLRGGSWNDSAGLCRSAFRARQVPGYRVSHLGFRVVRRL